MAPAITWPTPAVNVNGFCPGSFVLQYIFNRKCTTLFIYRTQCWQSALHKINCSSAIVLSKMFTERRNDTSATMTDKSCLLLEWRYIQWCHKYTVCKYKYKYKYSETLRVQVQVQVLAKFTSTSTSTEFQVQVRVQVLVLPSKVYSNSSKWLALLLICFIL